MMESDREDAGAAEASVRVLRAADADVEPLYPATRLLKTNVEEAAVKIAEAQEQLAQIRAECERVRSAARTEVEAVRQQAYEEGVREAVGQIGDVVCAVQQAAQRFSQDVADKVVDLVQTFAAEILHIECEISREAMIELVTSVLECAKLYSTITVVLHPSDVEVVRSHREQLVERLPFAESIHFKEDPHLGRHGCRIETEMGTFDGSLSVQLSKLHDHLRAEQGRRRPEALGREEV
ncbi:MAG: FliH/SctL family protein [Phycisphaerae bacterium]